MNYAFLEAFQIRGIAASSRRSVRKAAEAHGTVKGHRLGHSPPVCYYSKTRLTEHPRRLSLNDTLPLRHTFPYHLRSGRLDIRYPVTAAQGNSKRRKRLGRHRKGHSDIMATLMWQRDISSDVDNVKDTFSSWDSCMSEAYW